MERGNKMNISITGRNITVSDALKKMVEKKLGKLDRYFRPETAVNVVLSVSGYRQVCEVTIPFSGIVLRAEESTEDMYASIDGVTNVLERQIRRHRTKLNKRYRANMPEFVPDEAEDMEDDDLPKVVRTKRFAVKPLMMEEAVLQFQLLGHDFFVFLNADTDEVNVLYARKDGNYGLIEPTFDGDED